MYVQGVCTRRFSLIIREQRKKKLGPLNGQSINTTEREQACGQHSVPSRVAFASSCARASVSDSLDWSFLLPSSSQPDVPFIGAAIACGPSGMEIHRFQGQMRLLQSFDLSVSLQRSEPLIQEFLY